MKLQYWNIRELKQQQRRRQRKRHLESEFVYKFIALIPSRLVRQMLADVSGIEF